MVKGIVYLIIGTVGLLFGAVQPWIMAIYAVLMILAFVVLLWQGRLLWRPGPWAFGIVGFFLLGDGGADGAFIEGVAGVGQSGAISVSGAGGCVAGEGVEE